MSIKVLCIGAHNDEIMADMGGTAYALHQKGCETLFLNLACQWNDDNLSKEEKKKYEEQEFAAAEILGGRFMSIGNRDELLFLESKEIINETARIIIDYNPSIIFIHPPKDNHVEHRECARVAFKAICVAHVRGAAIKEVYSFDTGVMQSMDYFKPDFFVNVSDTMEIVKESLRQFNQNHAYGAHLAQSYEFKRAYRGRCGGLRNAEAFKIVKFPNGNEDFLLKTLLGDKFRWYGNGMYPAFGEEYF